MALSPCRSTTTTTPHPSQDDAIPDGPFGPPHESPGHHDRRAYGGAVMMPGHRLAPALRPAVAALAVVLAVAAPGAVRPAAAIDRSSLDAIDTTPSRYIPVAPARLLDTRADGAPVAAGATTMVPVAGRLGVPAGATAAALNVTVTEAAGPGFVT